MVGYRTFVFLSIFWKKMYSHRPTVIGKKIHVFWSVFRIFRSIAWSLFVHLRERYFWDSTYFIHTTVQDAKDRIAVVFEQDLWSNQWISLGEIFLKSNFGSTEHYWKKWSFVGWERRMQLFLCLISPAGCILLRYLSDKVTGDHPCGVLPKAQLHKEWSIAMEVFDNILCQIFIRYSDLK